MNFVLVKNHKILLKKTFSSQALAFEAALKMNIREIVQPVEDLKVLNGVFSTFALLEVVSVRDVARSLSDQNTSNHSYLIRASDGDTEVPAFEYNHWEFKLNVGCRVLFIPPIEVRRGVFLVNPNNIMLMTS
jgi:hypothetical protein